MPEARVNGVRLFHTDEGAGEPLVFVHGSWTDHNGWRTVVSRFADSHRVVTYDRRGHSLSERPPGPGSRQEDEDDLAALIETLALAPAHVAGNSFGAAIALGLAARRPELFRSVVAHEPPLFGTVAQDPTLRALMAQAQSRVDAVLVTLEAGDMAAGARQFVEEIALGPGAWDGLPRPLQQTFVTNAVTWMDEQADPTWQHIDVQRLARFPGPILLTRGTESPPPFGAVVDHLADHLPHAQVRTYSGAGHLPHVSHPDDYVRTVTTFLQHR
ncbi:alpha/beta fold hydrolase [Streptomyces alkaliterrae]|uniref:Alpha/beta fold hydrolase n=1 Tax=Streptomyces alkaliterrae TaxID=2213162 RepID=A0A5P0YX72_9ACTN|nr:alpha/beta hydrolase [Streptomyces alkaliterrae]MBB1255654.1 alpha/beta hydrolase [Streptomyces alkaliterrae]MBB1261211.1 alpha/beta hydrolase [Streptomyces alkaliterrae]MQS04102.1 alpha/beta fold hydrolase [Streptomyces alkaliterrae]